MISPTTTLRESIPVGTRVYNEREDVGGTIVGYDNDAYHATVNGRAVHVVDWDIGGIGGGWTAFDLGYRFQE